MPVFLKLLAREKERATMEQLKKLEQVQKTMKLIESGGYATNHQDSDRFLANLILLLVCSSEIFFFNRSYVCSVVGRNWGGSPTFLDNVAGQTFICKPLLLLSIIL